MFILRHGTVFLVTCPGHGVKIQPNAVQKQCYKGLEEPAAHTHQLLWRVPPGIRTY